MCYDTILELFILCYLDRIQHNHVNFTPKTFCYHSVLFLTDAVSWPCRERDVRIWMPPFAALWQKPFRSKFLRFWKVARVPVKSIWYDDSIHSFWDLEPFCNRATQQQQSFNYVIHVTCFNNWTGFSTLHHYIWHTSNYTAVLETE